MSILLSGKLIVGQGSLSALTRKVIGFIDGGPEWLGWALTSATTSYSFSDETALVAGIQTGLHGVVMAYLPVLGLQISPVKLLTFSMEDLNLLGQAEAGVNDALTLSRLQDIYAHHEICDGKRLSAANQFLAQVGLSENALFESPDFGGLALVADLMSLPQPEDGEADIRSDAAAFAVMQARTVAEFCDYYRSYMAVVTQQGSAGAATTVRYAQAQSYVEALLPLMFGALDCPQVKGMVPPSEVADALNRWRGMGRQLGFARLSEGVCCVLEGTSFAKGPVSQASVFLAQLQIAAQSFLSSNPPKQGVMSQDGQACVLTSQAGAYMAKVLLGPQGSITLKAFQAIPPQATLS